MFAPNLGAFSSNGFSSNPYLHYGSFSHGLPSGPFPLYKPMGQVNQVIYLPKSNRSIMYGSPIVFRSIAPSYGPTVACATESATHMGLPNATLLCLPSVNAVGLVNVSSSSSVPLASPEMCI